MQGCNIGKIIKGTITGEDEADEARFGNPIFDDEYDAESADVEAAEGGSPDEASEDPMTVEDTTVVVAGGSKIKGKKKGGNNKGRQE